MSFKKNFVSEYDRKIRKELSRLFKEYTESQERVSKLTKLVVQMATVLESYSYHCDPETSKKSANLVEKATELIKPWSKYKNMIE